MSENTKRSYYVWEHNLGTRKTNYSSTVPSGLREIKARISRGGIERLIKDSLDTVVFILKISDDGESLTVETLKSTKVDEQKGCAE